MSDPFRDGMEAALRRSETLEEENELLREEIARIREQAAALKEDAKDTSPETHALADQALGVLDQLAALSRRPRQVRVALDSRIAGEMRPLDAVSPAPLPAEHASADVIEIPKPKPKAEPIVTPAAGTPARVTALTMLAFGFGTFLLGIWLGTCVH